MTLGPHIGTAASTGRPTLLYHTLPPSPEEEPYAGSRADLPWKPYLRQLLDEDNNHCTSGGAPLELWYGCLRLSVNPSLCRVIQVQNRLAIWTESSHDFEMKYFFKKIFYLVHTNTLGRP